MLALKTITISESICISDPNRLSERHGYSLLKGSGRCLWRSLVDATQFMYFPTAAYFSTALKQMFFPLLNLK